MEALSMRWLVGKIVLLLALLGGCSFAEPAAYKPTYADRSPLKDEVIEYLFAVHPLHNPKRLFEVYQPLVELINETTEPEFRVRLEASRDYAAFESKLAARKFHFAVPNPYQTLESEEHGYRIIGKMGNDQRFRGILVVRRDSPFKTVTDLKGGSISFPAPTALAATMMPRMFLYRHGLGPNDFEARYVGSQESAIMNVLLGRTAAAGTWPPPWKSLLRRRPELARQLTVKWETDPLINNGLVARNDLPDTHVKLVEKIILLLHKHARGQAILEGIEINQFDPADTRTFEPVRTFMHDYGIAFGLPQ